MEIPKTGTAETTPGSSDPARANPRDTVPGKVSEPLEILELTLEEDVDSGTDPYNSTGEQIRLKLREDAKR